MQFSPPWRSCEALGSLFKCQESETKPFSPVKLVHALRCIKAWVESKSRFP